ncbi:permease [Methanospirillum sp.]|uniref:permease n=1 Tax=Methanospirillum sp. TaxID=45200 RepID=UPI00262A5A27|nr:permease [Methanospirillum sp.]
MFLRSLDFVVSLFRQVIPYLILGVAIIGVPMYIRAETIIPISAVIVEKGMGIGAVMALIIGGAGASIPEVTLIASIFEKRLVAAFVITVLGVAILAGVLFQFLANAGVIIP